MHASASNAPRPVTLARIISALDSLGHRHHEGADRAIIPALHHRTTVYLCGPSGGFPVLVMAVTLRRRLPMFYATLIAECLNEWHCYHCDPALSLWLSDDASIEVTGHSSISIAPGLTDAQLSTALSAGIANATRAVSWIIEHLPELAADGADAIGPASSPAAQARLRADLDALGEPLAHIISDPAGPARMLPPSSPRHTGAAYQDHPRDDGTLGASPHPLSVERLREVLHDVGVRRTSVEGATITAWINDIPFNFTLDPTPQLLIRARWDTELDPRTQTLRTLLTCSDASRSPWTARTFCTIDDQQLHLNAELTLPAAAGYNNAQLVHHLALSMSTVLAAIDTVSTQLSGTSAVHWPR